eukprot:1676452-Rhodomonas_salina.1
MTSGRERSKKRGHAEDHGSGGGEGEGEDVDEAAHGGASPGVVSQVLDRPAHVPYLTTTPRLARYRSKRWPSPTTTSPPPPAPPDTHIHTHTVRQADRQTDRQTDRQVTPRLRSSIRGAAAESGSMLHESGSMLHAREQAHSRATAHALAHARRRGGIWEYGKRRGVVRGEGGAGTWPMARMASGSAWSRWMHAENSTVAPGLTRNP